MEAPKFQRQQIGDGIDVGGDVFKQAGELTFDLPGRHDDGSVAGLESKLRFLRWIEGQLSRQRQTRRVCSKRSIGAIDQVPELRRSNGVGDKMNARLRIV